MSKFQETVERRVAWMARTKIFRPLFRWIAADPVRNEVRFIFWINALNILLYLTAAISPWIFLIWVTVVPWALFRNTPITGLVHMISQVRTGRMRFGSFVLTVFFLMLFYIAIFACLYMIFGEVVDTAGQPIVGIWSHFYFSTVTFTTLGYGNMVPSNFAGEVIASIEALVGFSAFAFLIGVASAVAIGRKEEDDAQQ